MAVTVGQKKGAKKNLAVTLFVSALVLVVLVSLGIAWLVSTGSESVGVGSLSSDEYQLFRYGRIEAISSERKTIALVQVGRGLENLGSEETVLYTYDGLGVEYLDRIDNLEVGKYLAVSYWHQDASEYPIKLSWFTFCDSNGNY
jgi:hypothetical protein